jgi:two-component system, NarL family, response regulator NreC
MRILVVDDNEHVRRGVLNILASETAWEVCGQAKDGEEAIRKARELLPDLVLLDISMPGMNGLEVTRILRREVAKVKILIMSQHDPSQILPRALDAGAQGCVDKGNLATDLLPRIQSIMRPSA